MLANNKELNKDKNKAIAAADISNWIVSIIQACSAAVTGIYVVQVCSEGAGKTNIVYGCRCKAVEIYLWVLWAYFVSDTFRLYHIHQLKCMDIKDVSKYSFFNQGEKMSYRNRTFYNNV